MVRVTRVSQLGGRFSVRSIQIVEIREGQVVVVTLTECYIIVGWADVVQLGLRLQVAVLTGRDGWLFWRFEDVWRAASLPNMEEGITDWHIRIAVVPSKRVGNHLRPIVVMVSTVIGMVVDVVDVVTVGVVVSLISTHRVEGIALSHREIVPVQRVTIAEVCGVINWLMIDLI